VNFYLRIALNSGVFEPR